MLEVKDWKMLKECLVDLDAGSYPDSAIREIYSHLEELAQAGDSDELESTELVNHYRLYRTLEDLQEDFVVTNKSFEEFANELNEGRDYAWVLLDNHDDKFVLVFKESGFEGS